MKLARCKAPDVFCRTLDGFGRRFGLGAFVDLDEPLGESGMTVGEALGEYADTFFDLVDPPEPAHPQLGSEPEP